MKSVQPRRLAFAAPLSLSFSPASCHAATEHWGWIGQSRLMPERMQAKAKLDTGALVSSLNARNIHRYKKDGKRQVRFDVVLPTVDSRASVSVTFERKVLRLIRVRGASDSDSRPVVAMDICLGAKLLREQSSLRDRGNMNYPVLLGRCTLEHFGAVDVSRTFTRKPTCGMLVAQQRNLRGGPATNASRGSTISAVVHRLRGCALPS